MVVILKVSIIAVTIILLILIVMSWSHNASYQVLSLHTYIAFYNREVDVCEVGIHVVGKISDCQPEVPGFNPRPG